MNLSDVNLSLRKPVDNWSATGPPVTFSQGTDQRLLSEGTVGFDDGHVVQVSKCGWKYVCSRRLPVSTDSWFYATWHLVNGVQHLVNGSGLAGRKRSERTDSLARFPCPHRYDKREWHRTC